MSTGPQELGAASEQRRKKSFAAGALGLVERIAMAAESVALGTNDAELLARFERTRTNLGPYGVDPFGFDPAYVRRFMGIGTWLYRHYFRVQTFGIDNLPAGRCLLVANHSGQLPYDGMMIGMACFLEGEPPRAVRSMVDRFVPSLPFVSPTLARLGQVLGTPANCRRLLAAEEVIQCFPEGTAGLNKTFAQRYRLQRFGHGFMRLALEMQAPIVPVAVIGAEEQAPSFWDGRALGKVLGLPALPLTPAPLFGALPLPVRYRLYFGAPLHFRGNPNDADAPIERRVQEVKQALSGLLKRGLRQRSHVFW